MHLFGSLEAGPQRVKHTNYTGQRYLMGKRYNLTSSSMYIHHDGKVSRNTRKCWPYCICNWIYCISTIFSSSIAPNFTVFYPAALFMTFLSMCFSVLLCFFLNINIYMCIFISNLKIKIFCYTPLQAHTLF